MSDHKCGECTSCDATTNFAVHMYQVYIGKLLARAENEGVICLKHPEYTGEKSPPENTEGDCDCLCTIYWASTYEKKEITKEKEEKPNEIQV